MTSSATSVMAGDVEAAIERVFAADETPDGRLGVAVLVVAFTRDALGKALAGGVGQCVLTCPTTACYNGIAGAPRDKQISVGGQLRFFGDTHESSKKLAGRRFWRIPVMDGEFVCEDRFGTVKGVAGGNLLICGVDQAAALSAAEHAAGAIRRLPDVILPFPGGIVRSGSKVGSRYKKLKASTNDAYCPTLRGVVKSALPETAAAVYEIVIDGLDIATVEEATRVGIRAACRPGVLRITAGNYGGKLGPFHLHLHRLLEGS